MALLEAIKDSFNILLHWQFYIIALGYTLLWVFPFLVSTWSEKSNFGNEDSTKQSWPVTLAESIIHIFATTSFIIILAPIILGISGDPNWAYPFTIINRDPYLIFKIIGLFLVLEFFVGILPVVGQYKSAHTLIFGSITLIYYLGDLKRSGLLQTSNAIHVVPHDLELLGFALLCIASTWGGVLLSALFLSLLFKKKEIFTWSSFGFCAISGFIPVFVYGAWIGNQM